MIGKKRIHVGTSGWHYDHWRGPFYPSEMKAEDFLPYYCRYLSTVEINSTFYHLPQKKTLEMWRDRVPGGFLFAVKASRFITHMKKLKDPEKSLGEFFSRVKVLGDRLGPILFQLPPWWKYNGERFHSFLKELPETLRFAFEFREPSWFGDEALEALRRHGAAFCIYDLAGFQSPREVTADFIYVRLHGPGGKYQGKYSSESLTEWAQFFSAWARKGKEIFCYFDNDQAGYAAQNAMEIQKIIWG